jgi:hypothetical protein
LKDGLGRALGMLLLALGFEALLDGQLGFGIHLLKLPH